MNVVVSDRDGRTIKCILENTDWKIALYVYDDSTIIPDDLIKNKRIIKSMKMTEIMNSPLSDDFSYDLINHFSYAFNTMDYGSKRISNDINFSHYNFYHSIDFWNSYFIHNDVDLCFCNGQIHGFDEDYIMQEISSYHNIMTFHLFYSNPGKFVLYNVNKMEFVNCNSVCLDGVKFNTETKNQLFVKNSFVKIIKKKIRKIIPDMGFFLLKNLFERKNALYYHEFTTFSYIFNYLKVKKILNHNKLYYKPVDYNSNFIVYFLHFEPEAVVSNYASIVDSQLIIIEALSKSIPDGWRVYVKEHPDTYKLNKGMFGYFIPCITNYITKYFFDKLVSFKNVDLIDYKCSSSKLIESSRAVSTIAGTIALEAVDYNKPVILFGNSRMFYFLEKDYLVADSVATCKENIKKIENGFIPKYDFMKNNINEYSVDENDLNRLKFIVYVDIYCKTH